MIWLHLEAFVTHTSPHPQDTHPVGAIVLTKHTIEHCAADIGRPFAFRVYMNEGLPLYLAADTEEVAQRWVAVTTHAAKQCDPWLEISTRNMKVPPNSIPRPDCFGYLMKLGNRWRTWSKRYCVLKDACLYFYHDANSRSAFGEWKGANPGGSVAMLIFKCFRNGMPARVSHAEAEQ